MCVCALPGPFFLPFVCHNFSTSHSENSIRLLKGARFICVSVKNSILSTGERENFLMAAKVKNAVEGAPFSNSNSNKMQKDIRPRTFYFNWNSFKSSKYSRSHKQISIAQHANTHTHSIRSETDAHTHFPPLVFELFCWFCLESSEKT